MTESGFKVIISKEEWMKNLESNGFYDFYHTYDYHHISKKEGEDPVLLTYSDGEGTISLPLLLRDIPNTKFKDATSVYGYAGPLSSEGISESLISGFTDSLEDYFKTEQIITVFSRLNPYISEQERVLKDVGVVKDIGLVVNIDLTLDPDVQRSQYRRDTRSRVNKARRLCTVRKAETQKEIEEFIDIYIETMQKLNADESYFFDKSYFFDFLKCEGFLTDILLAIDSETDLVAAGSMFVKTKNIVQYHLSGTRSKFMKIAPARLLLDEMRLKATEEGYRYFNLGGGYKSQEDALFNFKSSFSNDHKPFKVWNYISDVEEYERLCKNIDSKTTGFFPLYRFRAS